MRLVGRGRVKVLALTGALACALVQPVLANSDQEDVSIRTFAGAFLAARVAEFDSDTKNSIRYYRRALSFDPDNQTLQQNLMLALISTGEFDAALPYAEKLKSVANIERYSRLALAVDSIRAKDFKKSEYWLKLALESDLDRLISSLMTAWAKLGQGEADDALAHIDGMKGPDWYRLFIDYHRALIAEAAGRGDEAVQSFENVLINRSGGAAAPDTYLRAVEAYAGMLARQGKRDKALDAIERGETLAPGRPALSALKKVLAGDRAVKMIIESADIGAAEVLVNLGTAINRAGAEAFVRLYLQMSRVLAPQSDMVLMHLAAIAEQQEKPEEAIALYEAVPLTSPQKRLSELQLGLNLADLDRRDEAKSHLRALVSQDPQDIRSYLALGGVFSSKEEYAEAAALYDSALEQLGTPQRGHWNIYYQRGIAYERLKQWQKAEPSFREALKLFPEQPQVMNYLGYSWIDMNINLEEGLDMIRRAVAVRPRDGYIVDSLGWAYYRLGRFDEAVTELERAVSIRPEDPVINDHLGDAYWRAGRKLEATFQWSHARDMEPEPDVLSIIKKKLTEGLPPLTKSVAALQQKGEPATVTDATGDSDQAEQKVAVASKPEGASGGSSLHQVQPGQNLWSIAAEQLGDGNRFLEILEMNPEISANPNLIFPGQELRLPSVR